MAEITMEVRETGMKNSRLHFDTGQGLFLGPMRRADWPVPRSLAYLQG